MKRFIALTLGLAAYLAFPGVDGGGQASAGPLAVRELLEVVDLAVWTQTYEGYALVDRALGRVVRSRTDLADLALALEAPRHRAQLPELENRLMRMESAYRSGEGTWLQLARGELSMAPLRASERLELLPAELSNYEALRDSFMTGPTWDERGERLRDVQVFIRTGYGQFQPDLLVRVEALGMMVKGNYRNSSVLVGRAPERALRALSGIDGVDRVHALARSARPESGEPAMQPLDFIRGVNARSN